MSDPSVQRMTVVATARVWQTFPIPRPPTAYAGTTDVIRHRARYRAELS